jgi:hypothetical protein
MRWRAMHLSILANNGSHAGELHGYPSSGGAVPACSTLSDCSKLTYRTLDYYTVNMASATDIKTSLYTDGPTYFRFTVYSDFNTFWNTGTSGQVYKNASGSVLGGHAVLLIGWSDSGRLAP